MRNIFDQYEQPENKLTHALFCTLHTDRQLIIPFLKWLKIDPIPKQQELHLTQQQIPGIHVSGDELDAKGIPDGCIYNNDGWALLFESKVQAPLDRSQLERHLKTAAHHGYENVSLIVIVVNRGNKVLPEQVHAIEWREVYSWFRRKIKASPAARAFTDYMEIFESREIAKDGYLKQGTLTMFDGFCFDEDNPYTNREGKRLIRLLRDELQQRKDLQRLGVDPTASGRSAITGHGFDLVWDYLPLKKAKDAVHTAFPHLTMLLQTDFLGAAVTVPNGVKGGFRSKLKEGGEEGFRSLVAELELALQQTVNIKKSKGFKPLLYVHQRHFLSQRSPGIDDGWLQIDIRALNGCTEAGIKRQPEWFYAIYNLLKNKRSNIQFGVEVRFNYTCPIVRSRKVLDLMADTWIAMKPLLDFVLDGQ